MHVVVGSRAQVMAGTADVTSGGCTKKDFKVSKSSGEIVSIEKAKQAKKNEWAIATKKARARMIKDGLIKEGQMVLFNQGHEGKELYKLAILYRDGAGRQIKFNKSSKTYSL